MGPRALIDLSALKHNLQRVRECTPKSRIYAVIKANAYGHGMLRAARALTDADALAVARVEEGLALRAEGFSGPLMILEGILAPGELEPAVQQGMELVFHQPWQLQLLDERPLPRPLRCWLKVDTGMHRLGFAPEQARQAWERLRAVNGVSAAPGLMTHLACADDHDDPMTRRQVETFHSLAAELGGEGSISNSAGILGWPESHSHWVRPGIMLYGASPFIGGRGEREGLKPVMTLQSRLIAVNQCPAGEGIGYGSSWRCPETMPVGVVAIGYGDGYPRHAPSGTPVLLNGARVPLVGRVSMDMITLDLRSQPQARVGDPVILWGRGLPAEEIAERAQTIAYELFCGVTGRVVFEEVQE